jgi:hypothetical protein
MASGSVAHRCTGLVKWSANEKEFCRYLFIRRSKTHPRDLEGDLEGHWPCALKSPFKKLNFEYNIDI